MAVFLLLLIGCSGTPNGEDVEMHQYAKALQETDSARVAVLERGSAREQEALARFSAFYKIFSEEVVRKDVRAVYASNAYFRDPFKEVIGIDDLEAYFMKSTETIQSCTFDISDVAVHEGNYYFRWVMDLTTKRYSAKPIQAPGMSHVRFDENGKVVFHQDYWDSGVVYEQVFLLGSVIRWIKNQF